MSWGTDFTTDIFLSHLVFQNIGMLKDAISDKENDLAEYEAQIKMWAASTPKDVFTAKGNDPLIATIAYEVDEVLAEYKEIALSLRDLNRYLEHVEENKIDLSHDQNAD